jgi:hypothetical protein
MSAIAAAPICWQVSGGMLSDIWMSCPADRHSVACRLALAMSHSLRGRIRPVRSASGMNSSGAIAPRSASFQRARASTAAIRPDASSTIGW